jgi:hypothetical protein
MKKFKVYSKINSKVKVKSREVRFSLVLFNAINKSWAIQQVEIILMLNRRMDLNMQI